MQEPLFLALSFFAPYLGFSLNLQVNCSGILASEKQYLHPELPCWLHQRYHSAKSQLESPPSSLLSTKCSRTSTTFGATHTENQSEKAERAINLVQNNTFHFPSAPLFTGVCACYPTWTSQPPETQTDERLAHDPPGSQNQPLCLPIRSDLHSRYVLSVN